MIIVIEYIYKLFFAANSSGAQLWELFAATLDSFTLVDDMGTNSFEIVPKNLNRVGAILNRIFLQL